MDQPVARRTRSHAGKLASTEHNISSPLFKLPAEVRNNIYKFVVGGNLIHILQTNIWTSPIRYQSGKARFRHWVCSSRLSEDTAFETWKQTGHFLDVHNHCDILRCEKLSLQLLRTCRQIYDEARLLPYSENVFAFNRYTSFYESFATYLTKSQAQAIRAISLLTDTHRVSAPDVATFRERYLRAVKRFTGLQVIHIRLVAIFAQPETLADVCSTTWKQRYWANDVFSLGIHKLRHVTVIITPKHKPQHLDNDPEYPIDKKQLLAWAETMMTEMLGPWDVQKTVDLLLENYKARRDGEMVSWRSLP